MPSSAHAVVAGASVAGLAAACHLTAQGRRVTVVERRGDLLEGGRALLVQPNGLAALERLGALEGVAARGRRLTRAVMRSRGGRRLATYDYGELRHPHPYAVEIRPAALRAALAERLAALGGDPPRLGCEVTALLRMKDRVAGVRVREQGSEDVVEAGLVVGADGIGSAVRAALDIGRHESGPRDTYVLATVAAAISGDEMELHCGRGFCDGVMPLPDGTYLWDRVTRENRAAVEARDLDGWRRVYAQRVPRRRELADAIASWDEVTVAEVRPFWATAASAAGAVLVGDAAGTVHPHAAQGANLALEGALAVTDAAALGRWHRKLRRYVIWSGFSARSLDAAGPVWRAARVSGYAWNRIGPARRALLRQTAGLA